jgi:hypothetical protein
VILCHSSTPWDQTKRIAKRRDSRYRSGRCRDWVKVKNMAHPAIERAMLIALSKRQQAQASKRSEGDPGQAIVSVWRF